jgi:hypothetical protein
VLREFPLELVLARAHVCQGSIANVLCHCHGVAADLKMELVVAANYMYHGTMVHEFETDIVDFKFKFKFKDLT